MPDCKLEKNRGGAVKFLRVPFAAVDEVDARVDRREQIAMHIVHLNSLMRAIMDSFVPAFHHPHRQQWRSTKIPSPQTTLLLCFAFHKTLSNFRLLTRSLASVPSFISN